MLLETFTFHHPGLELNAFEYRAINPVFVNQASTIHGSWTNKDTVRLWAIDDEGIVGMTGEVTVNANK